jgi:hypothetical protein
MADIRPKGGAVRFFFTMNMQSRSGNPTHQVIGEVAEARNLDELLGMLEAQEFLLVEEFYKNPEGGYYSRGRTLLNTMHIGKVKIEG